VSGGLLIDKPAGWTSHDVVAVVRRQLGTRAVGHAGTLDPFATGLLVVLVGKATRLARFVEELGKRYQAVVRFGFATDTDDSTGAMTREFRPEMWPDRATIAELAATFVGPQSQRPPAFSAKHVAGTRSYVLARHGNAPELPEVMVRVESVDLTDWSPPDLVMEASVGRGTYIRALARDFGNRAGIPAHCAELRRTSIGPFSVNDAIAPDAATIDRLIAPAALLPRLPAEKVDEAGAREISFGRRVAQHDLQDGAGALLAEDGQLLAVADGREGWWYPVVVLAPAA
jgi:tRNA pseudouridine55 synthase